MTPSRRRRAMRVAGRRRPPRAARRRARTGDRPPPHPPSPSPPRGRCSWRCGWKRGDDRLPRPPARRPGPRSLYATKLPLGSVFVNVARPEATVAEARRNQLPLALSQRPTRWPSCGWAPATQAAGTSATSFGEDLTALLVRSAAVGHRARCSSAPPAEHRWLDVRRPDRGGGARAPARWSCRCREHVVRESTPEARQASGIAASDAFAGFVRSGPHRHGRPRRPSPQASVMAPRSAPWARRAYLASTPAGVAGLGQLPVGPAARRARRRRRRGRCEWVRRRR